VLIIDEAQHLKPEVLEEIRILSNLETNEQKLLQIVLVGQLNLLDVLHDAKLRQLDQRISIRCLLRPLNREEAEAYITHRLWIARGSTAVALMPEAIDLVHTLSGGVPRMINLLCDRALMAGCQARSDRITDALVREGAQALGMTAPAAEGTGAASPARGSGRSSLTWAAALVLIAAAVALTTYLLAYRVVPVTAAEQPAVKAPSTESRGLRRVTVPAPPEAPLRLLPPPISEGFFAVLVGTFDSPREFMAAEAALRSRSLPLYAVDLRFRDGVRRRLFVGRYQTRDEAEKLQSALARDFPDARVVTAETELWAE
jgi:cell division septation protein DedD